MKLSLKKISKGLLINLLVFLAILFSIEIFSFLIFKIWFWRKGDNIELLKGMEIQLNPSIGHEHTDKSIKRNSNSKNSLSNNNIYTEKIYGNGEKQIKLIILGGSSSDALGSEFSGINKTWPDFLGQKLSLKTGKQIKIYNAAVAAETRRGQIAGLYVDKKEILTGTIDSMSRDEVEKKLQELITTIQNAPT